MHKNEIWEDASENNGIQSEIGIFALNNGRVHRK
jgi:hypothetical protein